MDPMVERQHKCLRAGGGSLHCREIISLIYVDIRKKIKDILQHIEDILVIIKD